MAYVKLSADDIILAHRYIRDADYYKVYILFCRTDINKPNLWNLIPSTDVVVIGNSWGECQLYNHAIEEIKKIQEYKYPKIKEVKATLASEIDQFYKMINALHHSDKSK